MVFKRIPYSYNTLQSKGIENSFPTQDCTVAQTKINVNEWSIYTQNDRVRAAVQKRSGFQKSSNKREI